MTWRELLLVRILLLVARIVALGADDARLEGEIKNLANHISVHTPSSKPEEAA